MRLSSAWAWDSLLVTFCALLLVVPQVGRAGRLGEFGDAGLELVDVHDGSRCSSGWCRGPSLPLRRRDSQGVSLRGIAATPVRFAVSRPLPPAVVRAETHRGLGL